MTEHTEFDTSRLWNSTENPRDWQKCVARIHRGIDGSIEVPKDCTEKSYYEWIMSKKYIRDKVTSWLVWRKDHSGESQKNPAKAKFLREEGNASFKNKAYDSSIKSYTESARYANSSNDDDFSTAIANRSAALFYAGRYKESLRDIEVARSCGYPEATLWKLHLRAAECYLKLGREKLADEEIEKLCRFAETSNDITESMRSVILKRIEALRHRTNAKDQRRPNEPIPTIATKLEDVLPKNHELPFTSPSVICKTCPIRGRYVEAVKPIKRGDVLFVEKPFAWVPVTHGNDAKLCDHCCGSMHDSPIPCRGCTSALYCDSPCWNDARLYHRWECPGYNMGLWQQIGISHLAFKILVVSATTTDFSLFNNVQKLVTNIDKKDSDDIIYLGIASLMLTTYMEKYTNFFHHVDIEKCFVEKFNDKSLSFDVDVTTMEGKKLYVGSMILRHSLQMLANAYAVTKIERFTEPTASFLVEEQQRIAAGTYPLSSMLNHSCDATVINTFWKNWLIVKSLKNVTVGQEIFNCYGPYFKRMPKAKRREHLWAQYSFYCECEICKNSLFDSYTDRFEALKCPKCSGPLIRLSNSNDHRCYDCESMCVVTFEDALRRAAKFADKGLILKDNGKFDEAIPYFEKSLSIRKKYLYEHNEDISVTLDMLGQCHAMNGRWIASISYLEKSFAIVEEKYDSESIEVANELNKLTDICFCYLQETSNRETAEYRDIFMKTQKYVDRALDILSLTSGAWNVSYQEVYEKKAQLSEILKKKHFPF